MLHWDKIIDTNSILSCEICSSHSRDWTVTPCSLVGTYWIQKNLHLHHHLLLWWCQQVLWPFAQIQHTVWHHIPAGNNGLQITGSFYSGV